MAEYYANRASAGLIISEGLSPSIQGRGWYGAPDLFTPAHAASWRIVTDAIHARGGMIFAQPWHTGRGSHSSFRAGMPGFEGDKALGVAPSAIKRKSDTGFQLYTMRPGDVEVETPRELTLSQIDDIVEQYRNAAEMARLAGFDGVEVHCANGYLLDTFLQSCSNQRTDAYGGSPENRFRMIDRVIRAVLTVYPPSRVGVRISPNGTFNGMGSPDFRESFLYYATRICEFGVAYLHVMIGTEFGFHELGKPMVLEEFRKIYPGVIMANVGFDAKKAEHVLKEGLADIVSFGRAYLSNPDLVERFSEDFPTNPEAPKETWWSTVEKPLGKEGYSDFPTMEELKAEKLKQAV